MKSLPNIGLSLHVGKSRVSYLLGGKDLPTDAAQAENLIKAVGGSAEDIEKGLKYYRLAQEARTASRNPAQQGGSGKRRRDSRRQLNDVASQEDSGNPELEARVHTAAELYIPYIRRDVEDEAREFLARRKPVLLAGSSMVGKTRMAATLIRELTNARPVLIPDSKEELAFLGAADSQIQDSIIFLDDIDRLIGDKGISRAGLTRIAKQNVIIGTIRAAIYDGFLPTDRIRAPQGDVLSIFELVIIDRALSVNEKIRLQEAVGDPKMCRRIWRAGIGEYVGGARRITEALRLGRAACPIGLALVQGAADWSRAGISEPTPASLLPALASPHLDERGRIGLSNAQEYQKALEWATCVISPTVSLLQREQGDCFSVFDYALDRLADHADPIPESTWSILVDNTSAGDLNNVGLTAAASNNHQVAQLAWRKNEETGDPDSAPFAALYLGTLLVGQGDTKDAIAAFQRAVNSHHADAAPSAAVSLGDLHSQEGDLRKARRAYQQAISYQHSQVTAEAELGLGNLLAAQGDLAGAQTAYQRALDSDLDIAKVEAAFTDGMTEDQKQGFVKVGVTVRER
jgi:tetratricopeptide (TPR) repeat protein